MLPWDRGRPVRCSGSGNVRRTGFARLYDTATGAEAAQLKGPKGTLHAVAFSPNDKFVAAGGEDKIIRVWSMKGGEPVAELKGHTGAVRALRFGPTGTVLVSGSADKTAKVWELKR